MTVFEFVVTHRSSGPGFDVYDADVLMLGEGVGDRTAIDHVEVTLAPETSVDLFTAAAVAAEMLAPLGYRAHEAITCYGSFGRGEIVR